MGTPQSFVDPEYHRTSKYEEEEEEEEEGEEEQQQQKGGCTKDVNNGSVAPVNSNSRCGSKLQEEASVPDGLKYDLEPYCLVCTPARYRCALRSLTGMME